MNRIALNLRPQLPMFFGLLLVAGYLLITLFELTRSSYDISGAFLALPILVALSVPLLIKARRAESDPWIGRLFAPGLLVVMSMGFVRFFVAFYLYGGVADARWYSAQGAAVAAQFWQGDFGLHLDLPLIGIGFVILLTGAIYAIIGPTILGGYLVYSWLAFWGLYFCYRAFRTAMPGADTRRYAILIFFLPSITFWSSGIGKEAWMILCVGLLLLGAARLLSGTSKWILSLLAGISGTAVVRPHITALLVAGLLVGILLRKNTQPIPQSPIARAVSIAVVVAAGAIVVSTAASFLGIDTLSADSVAEVLSKVQQRTAEDGRSTYTAHPVNSPLDLPWAVITILFRPFPWEAGNLLVLASSVESTLFVVFVVLSGRRWRQVPHLLRRYPYITVALVSILLFVIAFSNLGNFGLLVRERLVIQPLMLVPLCLARRMPATLSDPDLPTVERVALR